MELWIRSKQKCMLIKVENLRIMRTTEGWNIIANDNNYIGTYKTKERALEVLDEIQKILEQVNDPNLTILPVLVSEMPEE